MDRCKIRGFILKSQSTLLVDTLKFSLDMDFLKKSDLIKMVQITEF